jgi:hypothetical protein
MSIELAPGIHRIPQLLYQQYVDSTRAHGRPVPPGEIVQASPHSLTPWKLGWTDSHTHSSQVAVTVLCTPANLPDRRSTERFRTDLPPVTDEVLVGKGISGERKSFIGPKHVALACPRRHELLTPLSLETRSNHTTFAHSSGPHPNRAGLSANLPVPISCGLI